MQCDRYYQPIFDPADTPQIRSAKAHSTVHNRTEHMVDVRLRTTYYAEYLTGGGLLLSRFGVFFRQLLDPAFRRGKIVGGRSHDCTRFQGNLSVFRALSRRRLAT